MKTNFFALRNLFLLALVLMLALVPVTLSAHASSTVADPVPALDPSAELLNDAAVSEYKGEKLDDLSAFRENSIKGVQNVDIASYKLGLNGLVNAETNLGYEDVLKMQAYQKVVTLNCVEGWSAKVLWQGVKVSDLIAAAGGAQDGAKVVIFHAADGYTTSLPLDFINQNNILLAYKINGITLPADKGFPFCVVAESKLGYKWCKWVVSIELSSDENYKGFWERNGYDNDASIGK